MTQPPPVGEATGGLTNGDAETRGALAVFRNRPFLLLWLSQAATQIGGNMVIYGLTVVVFEVTRSNSAVSALLLSFLVPAVLFSAWAGVYVDRIDRRLILVVTNLLRAAAFGGIFVAGENILVIYVLNVVISTITVFFAPAEAAMIPKLVPREQLIAANGVFTLTLNGAFALGFALLGPLVVTIAGAETLILVVAALYLVAALLCVTLPASPPAEHDGLSPLRAVADAEKSVESAVGQLREGLAYIRANRSIGWSLVYLGITASLIGVLGVLGPDFATDALGLGTKDFVVVVLPLGLGIVTGILVLNSYGRYLHRRRVMEGGMIALGVLLGLLAVAGPVSRFLQRASDQAAGIVDLSAFVSLLAVVIGIGFLAGAAYALVAIPAQTQLQEDLPGDVRGRVFGVLNMLVSVASFLPIIIVGPISDLIGTPAVIMLVAVLVGGSGFSSVLVRGPLRPAEAATMADGAEHVGAIDPLSVALHADPRYDGGGSRVVPTAPGEARTGEAEVRDER